MASSLTKTFQLISEQFMIYVSIPTLIVGVIGGLLNMIIFLSLKTFRESSCAFYLLVRSIMNVIQLLFGLLSRIMITGFHIDWTQSSSFYCKCRPFIIYITALLSTTCLCLATLDQYFATCSRPQWQQWSHIRLARRLVLFFSILWLIEQIPTFIFYNQVDTLTPNQFICTINNAQFAQFHNYFSVLTIWFFLPLVMTVFFAFKAYNNVQHLSYRTVPLVRRALDRQLTVMVLLEVLFNTVAVSPNLIINILILIEPLLHQGDTTIIINFAYTMSIWLYYVYFASPFYVYVTASERFRRQLIFVLIKLHLKSVPQSQQHNNQVWPDNRSISIQVHPTQQNSS